jgi:hypothetical protein
MFRRMWRRGGVAHVDRGRAEALRPVVILISCWSGFLLWFVLFRYTRQHPIVVAKAPPRQPPHSSPPPPPPPKPPIESKQILTNSCNDVVVSLQQVPQGNDPYPFLTDIPMEGGRLLVPGHPIDHLSLEEDHYMFFQACVPDESQHHHYHNIQVSVNPTLGDPDLFISVTNTQPTLVDSTWLSKSKGGETIVLASNHMEFPPGARTLYIGVRSRRNICSFSISIDITDRKNKYKGLRFRKDESGWKDKQHETWSILK